jgi:hypothetical protein
MPIPFEQSAIKENTPISFSNALRVTALFILTTLFSCQSPEEKEEALAKKYCSSCHLFPEPSLLNKHTWESSVLPEMSFRMGLSNDKLSALLAEDIPTVLSALPATPMVTEEEWKSITHFFVSHAPDSIAQVNTSIEDSVNQFDIYEAKNFTKGFITALHFDSAEKNLYVGNRWGKLYTVNQLFKIVDSVQLSSPPSHIDRVNGSLTISLMGIMDPNDQARGSIIKWEKNTVSPIEVEDSLKRPVHFENYDLNKDGFNDYVVSSFGNYTGALVLLKGNENKTFTREILNYNPGARKTIIRDFNADGLSDILVLMTQGDESVVLYTNQGNFSFSKKILLRFPPVYGCNYFETADFNGDGFFDILLTNGDNADYSAILKPYHAVRIFVNNGKNEFEPFWSFALNGASQAMARDFDGDNDLDIAAIAFFPDLKNYPERGFVYFENNGNGNFIPQVTPLGTAGRWLVMTDGDMDADGDIDLFLGAANFQGLGRKGNNLPLHQREVSLLVLENKKE